MSTKRCYYETLEVERTADDSRLKAAFRKLAMKWHPDKNPGDAASEIRFKEINEAYEVLKDGNKRISVIVLFTFLDINGYQQLGSLTKKEVIRFIEWMTKSRREDMKKVIEEATAWIAQYFRSR